MDTNGTTKGRSRSDLSLTNLESSSLWEHTTLTTETGSSVNAENILDKATRLCARRLDATDYRDSANVTWNELCLLRQQLHDLSVSVNPEDKNLFTRIIHALADVYGELGDYDKAERALSSICPTIPYVDGKLTDLLVQPTIDTLLKYLRLCAWTGRNTYKARLIGKTLSWIHVDVLQTDECRLSTALDTVRILHQEGALLEANDLLWVVRQSFGCVSPWSHPSPAVLAMLNDAYREANYEMVNRLVSSFVVASVKYGMWHRYTLDTLLHCGKVLRVWKQHEFATRVLEICCQGFSYTFGVSHPVTKRAVRELRDCSNSADNLRTLHRMNHKDHSCKRYLSLAFEMEHLTTIIDILKPVVDLDYEYILGLASNSLPLLDAPCCELQRIKAQCAFELGKVSSAIEIISGLSKSGLFTDDDKASDRPYRTLLAIDLAAYSASDRGNMTSQARSSISVFSELASFPKDRSHQAKAFHRRLVTLGLTHFTRELLLQDPPLLYELNEAPIGSGSYSVVDAVKVGNKLYARKSIHLPRRGQDRLREDIQRDPYNTDA